MMKRNVSEKLMLNKKKGDNNKKMKRFLISINVLGSAGPLRFVVNEDEVVGGVIDFALKTYSREGRLPVLGSDVNNFLLYCANAGSDALNPWEAIGSHGGRNFVLCKKQRQAQMTEGRSEMITRKTSGWKAWLHKSFNFKTLKDDLVLKMSNKQFVDYMKASSTTVVERAVSNVRWVAPSAGFIKMNTDAGKKGNRIWGLGVVFRNDKGEVLCAASKLLSDIVDVEFAEAEALRWGLLIALLKGYRRVVAECDNEFVIHLITTKSHSTSEIDTVVQDLRSMESSFNSLVWSHTKMNGNKVAHALAAFASSYSDWFLSFIPRHILDCIAFDSLALAS